MIIEITLETDLLDLKHQYSLYNWIDYGDLFISPGIIDLNVCFHNDFTCDVEEDTQLCDVNDSISSAGSQTSVLGEE